MKSSCVISINIIIIIIFDPGTQFPGNEKKYDMQYRKVQKSSWDEPYSSFSSSSFFLLLFYDEVEQVVVVQQVDADARAVHLLALDPQQTCSRSSSQPQFTSSSVRNLRPPTGHLPPPTPAPVPGRPRKIPSDGSASVPHANCSPTLSPDL